MLLEIKCASCKYFKTLELAGYDFFFCNFLKVLCVCRAFGPWTPSARRARLTKGAFGQNTKGAFGHNACSGLRPEYTLGKSGVCRKSYFLNLIEKVKYEIIRLFEKVKVKAVLKLVPFCRLSAIAMAVNAKF